MTAVSYTHLDVYKRQSLNCDASSEDREASTQKIQDFMKNLQNDDYEYYGSVIE